MKIKQLDIAGFRSLKNVSWQPGDLNVVIGQNGTGKSNLLRALKLLSASVAGRLSESMRNSGGMGAVLWDGIASSICISLKLTQPDDSYELKLTRLGLTSSYVIEYERWLSVTDTDQNDSKQLSENGPDNGQSPDKETQLSFELRMLSRLTESPIPKIYKNKISAEDLELVRLNDIAIYHDLNVSEDSAIRRAAVARFEKRVESDGQNLVSVLHTLYTTDREFERNIDAAMRAAFGADYERLIFTPDAGDQRIQMKLRWRSLQRAQSTSDLSDGTLRFLILLTVLTSPDPPMLIAIDEPETGLHPTMLPIIASFAVEASERTQIIFTTHSPQFLSAFGKTRPTTTMATWENGETVLQTLADDELEYWLNEYSFGELFESGQLEAMA